MAESPIVKAGAGIGTGTGDPCCIEQESNGSVHGVRYNEVASVKDRDRNGVVVYRRNKRLKRAANVDGGESTDSKFNNSGGKCVIKDGTEGISGNVESVKEMVEVEVKEESTLTVNCATVAGRRLTRSVLKLNVEPLDMSNENLEVLDGKLITCNGASPAEESEMEISKKISIIGRPTTVRELFETGLLEGYPVFYNGGKRGIPLRGTVKDIGILCSCDLCKGARVVPPGKFEIHACKTYRRASQYICLENGKSLLDVVKECRKGSLKNLEATIRSFIGPIPVKENIICQNCNGSFAATSVGKIDQICDSCIISLRSEATPSQSIKVEAGISEPDLNINSSEASTASDTSLKRRRGRKKKKPVEICSRKKSLRISSAHTISGRKDQLKTPNKLSNPVLSPHSNEASPMCNSFRDKMQSKISKKLSKSIAASNSSTIGSLGVSVHSRTQWKITKKDQKMHWLVFEEGGLPDGTEVAYYSRGKKLLVGYKQGSGIVCSCCNSELWIHLRFKWSVST
uniref:DNA binding protein n=1 Tax=Solanum tuberosum TaxID=4113 RepID=M0ZX83_SOLTU